MKKKLTEKELKLLREASYLLGVTGPDHCPEWKMGIGDCKKPECFFCRVQRCIDSLDNKIMENNEQE